MSEFRGDSSRSLSDSTPPQSIRRRKRHFAYLEAQEFVNKPCYSAAERKQCLDEIVKRAQIYKSDTKEKAIVLQHKEKEELVVLPYSNRFSEEYMDKQLAKLELIRWLFMRLGGRHTLLTVTLDPSSYIRLSDYRIASKKISELDRRIKRKYHPKASIRVYEPHTGGGEAYGQIHAHILYLGILKIDLDWLKAQLKDLGLGNENIKEIRGSGFDAVTYVLKYFKKSLETVADAGGANEVYTSVCDTCAYKDDCQKGATFCKGYKLKEEKQTSEYPYYSLVGSGYESEKVPLVQALLWALDLRFFSYSRSCLESRARVIYRLILHQWEYVGVYPSILFDKIPSKITDPNRCWEILQSKPPP